MRRKKKKENYTWSHTILGNDDTAVFYIDILGLIRQHLTKEEREHVIKEERKGHQLSPEMEKTLFRRAHDALIEFVFKQGSRLAWQVYGVLLMDYGAEMTEEIKELILKNSKWENERDQLKNPEEKCERFFYLTNFRNKVKNYVSGVKTRVYADAPSDVVERQRKRGLVTTDYPFILPTSKTPINHLIVKEKINDTSREDEQLTDIKNGNLVKEEQKSILTKIKDVGNVLEDSALEDIDEDEEWEKFERSHL